MAVQRLNIKEFLQRSEGAVLLDVRSPGEYNHAHIPSAVSLPLFSDEERKIVGTTYKQKSREEAIKIGLDFFGPKMKKMVEEVEQLVQRSRPNFQTQGNDVNSQDTKANGFPSPVTLHHSPVFVYCWRGGMRSAAIAWLLDLYGFRIFTLAGGYKSFRNQVLQTFDQSYSFKILGGYTGSGKTEVLNQLPKLGEAAIDLEGIACHKGSAFGSFKMPKQPTQEMFENLLAKELWNITIDNHSPIWLEDESQRIGNLNIPQGIWKTMRSAPVFFLDIPFEERLQHIVEEYGECDRSKLIEAVQRISQRLGGLDTKNTIAFLESGNLEEAFSILLKYYDKRYLKGLHNRDNVSALLTKIECPTVSPENARLLTKYQPV